MTNAVAVTAALFRSQRDGKSTDVWHHKGCRDRIEFRSPVEPLVTCSNEPPEFVPDQKDMEFLARAYLDKAVGLLCHYFLTGTCESDTNGSLLMGRFEKVAKVLGEEKRQEIIDAMDEREARACGDQWQAFKTTWDGFGATPADREAILRLVATMPIDLSEVDIGPGLYGVIMEARGNDHPDGIVPEDSHCEITDAVK